MKIKRSFYLFGIVILLAGCRSNSNPAGNAGYSSFGIYLLKDDSLKIGDIENTNIDALELAEDPWLSSNDIDFYDCSTHFIYLKGEKSELFPNKPDFKMIGRPFVVVANHRRCYVGMFYSLVSSTIPIKPYIYIEDMIFPFSAADVLPIEKARIDSVDIRNDLNV